MQLETYAPEFTITLEEKTPTELLRSNVISISVKEELGKPAEFSFVVSVSLDPLT